MIGKSEWFERRKYGGWGLNPKTWQGWVYILGFILPLLAFHAMPFWDIRSRLIVTGFWALVLIVDTLDIMAKMKKDERETLHEAIAERNAMWVIIVILTLGLAYQISVSALNQTIMVDWWIVAALVMGLFVKSISNIYLDKND